MQIGWLVHVEEKCEITISLFISVCLLYFFEVCITLTAIMYAIQLLNSKLNIHFLHNGEKNA